MLLGMIRRNKIKEKGEIRETERVPDPDGKVCDLAPNCT